MRNLFLTLLSILFGFVYANAQIVTLDYYFNHEVHKDKGGKLVRYHYTWEDTLNTGFSILGEAFKKQGAKLKSLETAPTFEKLKATNIYIIVDPDTKMESDNPNYIGENDINEIEKWVKNGGVLVMFANDSANVELPHYNHLAVRFGMRFNDDLQNHVVDDKHFEDGAITTVNNSFFITARKIFMKDVCSISVRSPAYAALRNNNKATVIAIAKYGKGTVLAVGDPWLYNEYTNGRLPADFENKKAADDIVKWLIKQVR